MRRNSTGEAAFTLLEVLVSLSLVAIAITVFVQLLSSDVRAIAASEDLLAAGFRTETKMREVLDDPGLTEKTWTDTTTDGYRMEFSVTEVMKERTEGLSVKLLEITLTTHWKKGFRDKSLVLKAVKMVNTFESESAPKI